MTTISGFDKWFNILLCRSDLNEESLENQPVSFRELVRIYLNNYNLFPLSLNTEVVMIAFWPISAYFLRY